MAEVSFVLTFHDREKHTIWGEKYSFYSELGAEENLGQRKAIRFHLEDPKMSRGISMEWSSPQLVGTSENCTVKSFILQRTGTCFL